MTDEVMKARLSSLTGETDDNILLTFLEIAAEKVLTKCYPYKQDVGKKVFRQSITTHSWKLRRTYSISVVRKVKLRIVKTALTVPTRVRVFPILCLKV